MAVYSEVNVELKESSMRLKWYPAIYTIVMAAKDHSKTPAETATLIPMRPTYYGPRG